MTRRAIIIRDVPDQPPSIENLGHDLRAACMRISRKVRHEASEVPPHFVTVMAKLAAQPRTASELAQAELVSAPSMSRTIGDLEEAGMLTREISTTDRRKQILTLTDKGFDVLEEIRTTRDSWMTERLREFSDEERALLVEATVLMNRLVHE